MATTDLDLAADPDVQAVAFDLPASVAPYARDYFDNSGLKREGETLDLFICRLFCERAMRWETAAIMATQKQTARDLETLDEVDLNDQANVILAAL